MLHKIITIGREFGSGGLELGEALAKHLGLACYDKNLIQLAAQLGDLPSEHMEKYDERKENALFYEAVYEGNGHLTHGKSYASNLYQLQSTVIRSVAAREDAVIIGRCADFVLHSEPKVKLLTIFVTAPMEWRVQHIMKREGLEEKQALRLMQKTDRQRSKYYTSHTGRAWGAPDNYMLNLDASRHSKAELVEQIAGCYQNL